ncbi:putative MFS-type transporter [Pandoraea iniqua]|uniref:Putative MFS-type transporter n=1 Tax=Pandoraea iniqua TaxID=2508288 RepID=A0A5E4RZ05_9BURK|nr:MFS transporter [Pandoraea iniqua]VVD67098.1 putative MFS-type transporter [Pandoraea iniqua]
MNDRLSCTAAPPGPAIPLVPLTPLTPGPAPTVLPAADAALCRGGTRALGREHRWKVLGVGVAANASFAAALGGLPATAVQMRSDYALANGDLGLVLGLIGLGIAVSELPWGMLTDRWGDRRVLLVGLMVTAAALFAMGIWVVPTPRHVPPMPLLAAGMLAIGILGGSVNGSSGRAVMRWFHDGERGLAMSVRQCAVPLGGGIGAMLLPGAALHFGFAVVYIGLAVACVAATYMAWLWLLEPPEEAHEAADAARVAPVRTGAAASAPVQYSPLRDARLLSTALGMAVLAMPQIAVLTFGTVFLHDFAHVSVLTISLTLGAVQTGAALTRVWSGRYTDKRRNRPQYLRVCTVTVGVVFALLAALVAALTLRPDWLAHDTPWLIALLIVGGMVASAWHGVAFTELATLAGASRAGTALGIGNTGVFMTMFVTPLSIPFLLSIGGWALVWSGGLLCAALAWPLFVWSHRARAAK